jgi:hypothetical protein
MFKLNTKNFLASTTTLAVALGMVAIAPQSAKAANIGGTWDNNKSYCTELDLGKPCTLQNLLDSVTLSGPGVDVQNDQTGYDWFSNTATGNATGSFMFELGDYAPENVFGIYNSSGDMIELFDGINDPGDSSYVTFLTGGKVSVVTQQFGPGADDPTPVWNIYEDFGNGFGFYVTNKKGETFYTQNSKNAGGYQQAVVYQGDDETVMALPGKAPGTFTDNEFIIAFEDLWLGNNTDSDFNDLVVMVESVEPVPEPATMAGLGLVGAAMLGLRRKNKKNN